MKKRFLWLVPIIAVFVWACSSDDSGTAEDPPTDGIDETPTDDGGDTPTSFDRAAMLLNWADNIIIPAYSTFLLAMDDLQTAYSGFETAPTEDSLDGLRGAYMEAYVAWQYIDMFEIGPAEAAGLRLGINTYPTDVALIAANITSGDANFELSSNRDSKGFPALDYLLYGIADTDVAIVAVYTDSENGTAHLTYMKKVIDDIDTSVGAVAAEWTDNYRDTFIAETGTGASASVDRFANDFLIYYEKSLRTAKMGTPLGVISGVVSPQTIESLYNPEFSNELFLEGMDATQDFFNGIAFETGDQGLGFDDYLAFVESTTLATDINTKLDDAISAVEDLRPFATELDEDPSGPMLVAYGEVQELVALFKSDMFSALSIAIDFQDTDND